MSNLQMLNKIPNRTRTHARVLTKLASCALDPTRPIMAHLVVTRRCNLSCGYCSEYDKHAQPAPLARLKERIDHLLRLRTVFVVLTGGEALLHPDIVKLVSYVAHKKMIPVLNSNGFLLTKEKIEEFNSSGLYAMQVSVDAIHPDETSKKALRPLAPKLRLLARHASFRVRVNTVLRNGSGAQAIEVTQAVTQLGFDAKCTLVRNEDGSVCSLGLNEKQAYETIRKLRRKSALYLREDFQVELLHNGSVSWKCRSGARYFTVCENGLVHLCESSYGSPGKNLLTYGEEDIRRAFATRKSCSSTCAVPYAHQASTLDRFRPQKWAQSIKKRSWMQQNGKVHLNVL